MLFEVYWHYCITAVLDILLLYVTSWFMKCYNTWWFTHIVVVKMLRRRRYFKPFLLPFQSKSAWSKLLCNMCLVGCLGNKMMLLEIIWPFKDYWTTFLMYVGYKDSWYLIGCISTNRKRRCSMHVRVVSVILPCWHIVLPSYHGNHFYYFFRKYLLPSTTTSVLIIHVKRYRLNHTHLNYYKRSNHIRIPKYLIIGKDFYY